MANGVSCAYFAVRNYFYGKKEHNLFKDGIGVAQTVRTAGAAGEIVQKSVKIQKKLADMGYANKNILNTADFLTKKAEFCKNMLYPLIIASGVYNTIKSDDKVKTGISQGSGILSMRYFEKAFEKFIKDGIPKLVKKIKPRLSEATINKINGITNKLFSNKYGKILKYVLQGALFATVSMTGYNVGSGVASKIVDKVRGNKYKNSSSIQVESGYTSPKYKENIFDDIEIIKE